MKFQYLFLTFLIFIFNNVISQEETGKPSSALKDYFELPRESLYLHLNKSSYVEGEALWFKGYVFDRFNGVPLKETSNIYVGIYDCEGKQKDKRLFLATEGYSQGHFVIDSTFTEGSYYIKAATNWMKNFNEDDSYIQKFQIVDLSRRSDNVFVGNKDYDLQFLPEGGHLLANVANTVGVKVLDNKGSGVRVNGISIKDGKGNEVANFSTGDFGHGKFVFTPEYGTRYSTIVNFGNDLKKEFTLPVAMRKGINMSIKNNSYQEFVAVVVGTNAYTLKNVDDLEYYALVHRNGQSQRIPIVFEENETEAGFLISKKDIKPGVNTVTIFTKDDKPILERLFFNSYGLKFPKLEAEVTKVSSDSLTLDFVMKGTEMENFNLSASILPLGTDSYNHHHNIHSVFLLKPFIKGHVENASYYFEETSPRREYELDLLLLNQGWSRYDWSSIFDKSPKPVYEFEKGLDLNISLNDDVSEKSDFYIFPTSNHLEKRFSIPKNEKTADITDFFLFRDEEVFIAEEDSKGKLAQPKIYVRVKNQIREDRVIPWDEYDTEISNAQPDLNVSEKLILDNNTIALDEVVVTEDKLMEKARNNVNVQPFLKRKITPVDENTVFRFPTLLDLIAYNGYSVYRDPRNFSVQISSRRGGSLNIWRDGQKLPNLDFLVNVPTEEIESYFFDRNKTIPGIRNNFNEALYIFTRRGGNFINSSNSTNKVATEYKVENGFENTKEFYTPKYNSHFSESFEKYGVIHWEPEVKLENNRTTFKVQNTGLQKFKIYFEGMDAKGNLYSGKKEVRLENF